MSILSRLLRLLLVLLLPGTLPAQHALVVIEDGQPHFVTNVSNTNYRYMVDGKTQRIHVTSADARLIPTRQWFPGYVMIEDQNAIAWTRDTAQNPNVQYTLEYKIKIRPNRDIRNAYLIYFTTRPDGGVMKIACPVGDLRKGKVKRLTHSLDVPRNFADTRFQTLFMSQGFQILSGEVDVALSTPYQKWLHTTPSEGLENSEPRPISILRPNPVKGPDGELLRGEVKLKVEVDASGYVIEAKAVDPKTGPLVQSALDVIHLWEFKPKIVNGEPVGCNFVVPFHY